MWEVVIPTVPDALPTLPDVLPVVPVPVDTLPTIPALPAIPEVLPVHTGGAADPRSGDSRSPGRRPGRTSPASGDPRFDRTGHLARDRRGRPGRAGHGPAHVRLNPSPGRSRPTRAPRSLRSRRHSCRSGRYPRRRSAPASRGPSSAGSSEGMTAARAAQSWASCPSWVPRAPHCSPRTAPPSSPTPTRVTPGSAPRPPPASRSAPAAPPSRPAPAPDPRMPTQAPGGATAVGASASAGFFSGTLFATLVLLGLAAMSTSVLAMASARVRPQAYIALLERPG